MNIRELILKPLTIGEIQGWLEELMNYSCNISEVNKDELFVFNEFGLVVDLTKLIGRNRIDNLNDIILLKEKIDEKRGSDWGVEQLQGDLKRLLNIKR